jgi:hypothetical protein
MAYTPELNQFYSAVLRRIAWAMNLPMTKAQTEIFDYLGRMIAAPKVCEFCRDDSFCHQCPFNRT